MARTIAVSGTASGLGLAVRQRLEAAGDRVVGVDLRDAEVMARKRSEEAELRQFAASPPELKDTLDACDYFAWNKAQEHKQRIAHSETPLAEVEQVFRVNFLAAYATMAAVIPGMVAKGKGAIVNIASGASSIRGIPNRYVYGTTKAAVIGRSSGTIACAAHPPRRALPPPEWAHRLPAPKGSSTEAEAVNWWERS